MTPENLARLEADVADHEERIRELEREAVPRRDHSKLEERMRVQETTSAKGLAVLAVIAFVATIAANVLTRLWGS